MAAFAIFRWRREHKESPLGRERLGSAMRVGVQFVSQSYRMRALVLRIGVFFLHSTALLALLPLIARALPGGGAGSFTLLLASMGSGAILAVLVMPRIRRFMQLQPLIAVGTLLHAAGGLAVAFATSLWVAVPAMFVCGIAWITVANANTVAAQMALPDWVRARGMSIYQMAIMGASALGAALWGQVATLGNIHQAVVMACVSLVVVMGLVQRFTPDRETEEDLSPAQVLQLPDIRAPENDGRVQTRIEYLIDPARAPEFLALMEASRSSRLRQGALSWELLHDLSEPGRYVEQIIDESWTEHLRRFDRISAADANLRERRMSFHIGEEPPRVTRFLIEHV
jgi:MFS family permease